MPKGWRLDVTKEVVKESGRLNRLVKLKEDLGRKETIKVWALLNLGGCSSVLDEQETFNLII